MIINRFIASLLLSVLIFFLTLIPAIGADSHAPCTTISLATREGVPWFTYRFSPTRTGMIKYELACESHNYFRKGVLDYPNGYKALVDDLINGFQESSMRTMHDGKLPRDHKTERDLIFTFYDGSARMSFRFQGSSVSYATWLQKSQRLVDALWHATDHQLLSFRL